MYFNTLEFLIFFPICLILYYNLPFRTGKWALLIFSLFFYSRFSHSALFVLVLVAVISWASEIIIRKVKNKFLLFLFSALTLLPLMLLKYMDAIPGLALPVGISFFTLQAVSGIVDSYKQKNSSTGLEEHLLYLSFFPTVVSGPIMRKKFFLEEISKPKSFSYEEVRRGFYRIAIGYIEKFFLADQIGKQVNYVYNNFTEMTGVQIGVTTILYCVQLYFDFSGYSHMALGFAKCFGITLMENFERPFFATSIKEFWRRWHKSLSSWLRDYVYIPLGGSRNGTLKKYRNLVVTFLVSGIWHGVGLNFLFWGFLHGIYQVLEDLIFQKTKISPHNCNNFAPNEKNHIEDPKRVYNFVLFFRTIIVFLLITFSFLFFRAPNMTTAIQMLKKIMFDFQLSSLLSTWWFYGMCKLEYIMWCAVAIGILAFDIMEEKNTSFIFILEQKNSWFRWFVYTCVVFIILIAFTMTLGSTSTNFLYQNF